MTKDFIYTVAGLVVGGILGFGIGDVHRLSTHKDNVKAVIEFAAKNGCVDLGPPDQKHPLTPYVEAGFNCDGAIVVITK